MHVAPQACALRLSSAGHRARPLGHVGERATQRLEAERALVLVSRSCRGGARALPRPSELLAAGAPTSRESGLWLSPQPRFVERRIVRRCAWPVPRPCSGRWPAASRRARLMRPCVRAHGADERARLGREPQPHEIHIPRRAWSVRGGRGRFGAPAMPWASGQASSQVVRISSTNVTSSCTRCEGFAGCRRVWFRWFSVKDLV